MNKKMLILLISIVILIILILGFQKYNNVFIQTEKNETLLNSVNYQCDNSKKIDAEFYNSNEVHTISPGQPPIPTGFVKLTLNNGVKMTLKQTISADGGRYANEDESFVFWDKGNGAMILENAKEVNYKNCILIAKNPDSQNLSQVYKSPKYNFTILLPDGYITDESYVYQMTPEKNFNGVKFTIPENIASGTNLGSDTYLSVEKIPGLENCSANTFLDDSNIIPKNITDNGIDYSFASSTGAGAGNRYEETIYAFPTLNSCMAVRYFVHYGVFENYPEGTIKEFDRQKLLNEFDKIRKTLIVK